VRDYLLQAMYLYLSMEKIKETLAGFPNQGFTYIFEYSIVKD
jgi:hypothetical protein